MPLQVCGSAAHADGQLQKEDRILEINCQDMASGTQEQAAQVIQVRVNKSMHVDINKLLIS